MSSTSLREPVGPRSVDEMLAVVYGRTARSRRRRQYAVVLTAMAAALLTAGSLTFVGGVGDEQSVRVVGEGSKARTRSTAGATTTGQAPASDEGTGTETPSDPSKARGPSGKRHDPALPPPADGPGEPSVPSPGPVVRVLREVSDAANDATPPNWYLDVVHGSATFDGRRQALVLTTLYRASDGEPTSGRAEHTMTSLIEYDNAGYEFTVVERGDELGDVTFDSRSCSGCTATFDPASARLVVIVPLSTFNAEVRARDDDNRPLGADSVVTAIEVSTSVVSGFGVVQSDTSSTEGAHA